MKDELLHIGNYQIEVSYYGAAWAARVLNAPREIIGTGQTREQAVDAAMRVVRGTQPKHGTLEHFKATEKLRYTNGYNDFGKGFTKVFGVK